MSTTEKVTVTIKGGGEAPWIVWHADDNAEAARLIEEAFSGPLFQDAAEASALFAGAVRVANGMGPAAQQNQQQPAQRPQDRQQVQQNQGGWQQNQNQQGGGGSNFTGTPHPEGKTCPLCGAGIVGKQPKIKKMWTCPNQRTQGDGHYVEWING